MEHINRRELIKTTGAGAGIALTAGAAEGDDSADTSSDPVQSDSEHVSTVGADAQSAEVAIDIDPNKYQNDPDAVLEQVSIDEPLVSIEGGKIFDDGTLEIEETDITVADLVDVILGLDPEGTIVDLLEELDIQTDIIDNPDITFDGLINDLVDTILSFVFYDGTLQTGDSFTVNLQNDAASAWILETSSDSPDDEDTRSDVTFGYYPPADEDLEPEEFPNPELLLVEGVEYTFESIPSAHPLEFLDSDGNLLLSQQGDGSFEDDEGVSWSDTGNSVTFTVTSDLAAELAAYRCAVHSNSMAGEVQTTDDSNQVGQISSLVAVLAEESGLNIPVTLLTPIVEDVLVRPEKGIQELLSALPLIVDGIENPPQSMEELVNVIIGVVNEFVITTATSVEFTEIGMPSDAGTYDHGVSTDDDSETTTINVGSSGSGGEVTRSRTTTAQQAANFQVSSLDAPGQADPGSTIDVSATVTNTGDTAGTQDVTYQFDGSVLETTEVSLEPGSEGDLIQNIDQFETFLVEQAQSLNLSGLGNILSITINPGAIEGTVDPGKDPLLIEVPLDVPNVEVSIEVENGPDPISVGFEQFSLELTTGASGNLAGSFTGNTTNDTADATIVDNEFTANITEFDLLGLVNELENKGELEKLISALFNILGINPEDYEDFSIPAFVEGLNLPSLVENGEPLELLAGLITDESGRHAIRADLGMTFSDLDAVLDISLGPPPLPGNENKPQDLGFTPDGTYEDVDGNGEFNIFDVQAFFINFNSAPVQNNPEAFNFDGSADGEVNIFDVQALFLALAR